MKLLYVVYLVICFNLRRLYTCFLTPKQRAKEWEKSILYNANMLIQTLKEPISKRYPIHVQRAEDALIKAQDVCQDANAQHDDKNCALANLLETCSVLINISRTIKEQQA